MFTEQSEKFIKDGFVLISDIFPILTIENARAKAVENFHELQYLIALKKLPFGIGIKNGFREIVQRHQFRFEMTYKMEDNCFNFVLNDPNVKSLVSSILQCDDYVVSNRSLVVSIAGCSDQAWHTDGPHMSATTDLPCHCLNVFVPLVDITDCNGPTEFRPGSQWYTRDLAKSMLIAKLKKTLRPIETPILRKGSLLLFDYRVLHRGTANRSDELRPILVFTFAKPWYKDTLNFPHRSISDQEPVEPEIKIDSRKVNNM